MSTDDNVDNDDDVNVRAPEFFKLRILGSQFLTNFLTICQKKIERNDVDLGIRPHQNKFRSGRWCYEKDFLLTLQSGSLVCLIALVNSENR